MHGSYVSLFIFSMTYNDLFSADACNDHLLVVLSGYLEVDDEVLEDLSNLLRLVFMNHVAHLVKHDQLELALHLRDRQLLVHAV